MQALDLINLGMDLYRKRIVDQSRNKLGQSLLDKVGSTPGRTIFSLNKMKVVAYKSDRPVLYDEPVLLIPSLINRAYIMDLLPKFSLANFLIEQGFRVYLVDWGIPSDEDRLIEFDSLIDPMLNRAVSAVINHSGSKKTSIVGYCMGATLGVAYTALFPNNVSSFVNLLGPIDFAEAGMLHDWTRPDRFDPRTITDAFGNVPPAMLQSAFQGMRPLANVVKQVRTPGTTENEIREFFDALEYWAWDNIPFPGVAYNKYIQDLYQKNKLIKNELMINGERVDLGEVTCPVLVLTADKDHIVPTPSAQHLEEFVGSKDTTTVTVRGGHVAAVVGPAARLQLWPKMAEWLAAHSKHVS
jgi:polyhydroxyalkanoate synthase